MAWEQFGYTSEGYTSCGTYVFWIAAVIFVIGGIAVLAAAKVRATL